MMYNNKLAAAIKVNNKVLREFKDTVYVPFASEYSLLIKNLNIVKVLVNVYIDGEEVTPGGLAINAGNEIDLERFIKNGNLTEGNKFKFIERNSAVEQHRGIKLEDGIVRIEYQFEKVYSFLNTVYPLGPIKRSNNDSPYGGYNTTRSYGTTMNCSSSITSPGEVTASQISNYDAGITVPGSKSDQKFQTVSSFPLETEKHSIVLKLLGETPANKPVIAPVTVKAKPRCTTCNHQNKATAKFCSACGTALEIFA